MNHKLFAVLGFFLTTSAVSFASNLDDLTELTIVNNTKYSIDYLFVSPQDTDVWGPDLLGATGALGQGESRTIDLYNSDTKVKYDVLAVDTEGNRYEAEIQITTNKFATVKIGTKNMKGTFESTFQEVTIVNDTETTITYLFFSSEKSETWGADLLGQDVQLEPGDSHAFHIPIYDDSGVTFNVLGMDDDVARYQVDVTAAGTEEPLKVTLTESDLAPEEDY